MQLFLQPINQQQCDHSVPKVRAHGDFCDRPSVRGTWKGCELRCLSFSFAT